MSLPLEVIKFLIPIQEKMKEALGDYIGFYLHGSLALGGFQHQTSDVDILIIVDKPLRFSQKKEIIQFLLKYSKTIYPIEISILLLENLQNWNHPCSYEVHYSEYWRERYEQDLQKYLTVENQKDNDLAAHLTVTYERGICLEGKQIKEVFPKVPKKDYLSAILGDFEECISNIEENPVYSILNMLRVYLYLKEELILSKEEAGKWAGDYLPLKYRSTINWALAAYYGKIALIDKRELIAVKNYLLEKVTNS